MFRIFSLSVVFVFALFTSAVQAQVQFIDVDPGNEGIVLGGNWYNPANNHLYVPGANIYGEQQTTSSWIYDIDLTAGSWNRTLIPSAINNGNVFGAGISRDGQYVFGWMDSPGSDPGFDGEGFFAPISAPSNRTLIGFLPSGVHESHVFGMSSNGMAVGDSGGTAGCIWTASGGIEMLPVEVAGSLAHSVSADGRTVGGNFNHSGFGTQGAGTWNWNNGEWSTHSLPPENGSGSVVASSSDGSLLGGSYDLTAAAWLDGSFNQLLYDDMPFLGTVRAVTDDGFFVGVGELGGTSMGFVWHEGWAEAMTARDYVLWSQGIDIGHDIRELNGAFSYGGNLYLTGYGSGAILQTPAFVPEPGALALLGVGSLLGFRRRRA